MSLEKLNVNDSYSVARVGSQTGIVNENLQAVYKAFNRLSSRGDAIKSSANPSLAISDKALQDQLYDSLDPGMGSKLCYILHPDLSKKIKGMTDPSDNVKVK